MALPDLPPDVADHLGSVAPPQQRADAFRLEAIFRETTGFRPRIWSASVIGYGRYDYTYASGRSGSAPATGFAARKANLVLYIMPGYADFAEILARLGSHRRGKACLYLTRLDRVDEAALRDLIRAGLDDLARRWPIVPA